MSDNASLPQAPAGPLVLNLQYTKDLSFEVPGAPEIFATLREQPRVDLQLDVQARPLQEGGNVYEVSLQIRADAQAQGQTCFIAELVYCGIFTITVEPEVLEPVLLVECPRLLLPLRPQHPGRGHPRRRLPAGDAGADRFRRALAVPPRRAGRPGRHRLRATPGSGGGEGIPLAPDPTDT